MVRYRRPIKEVRRSATRASKETERQLSQCVDFGAGLGDRVLELPAMTPLVTSPRRSGWLHRTWGLTFSLEGDPPFRLRLVKRKVMTLFLHSSSVILHETFILHETTDGAQATEPG